MWIFRIASTVFCTLAAGSALAGPRLDAIMERGHLNCGVAVAEPGMSQAVADGEFEGFEPDICRAIAAAVFGAPELRLIPAETLVVFLQSDEIDLVIRGLTRSFRREVSGDVRFGPTILHNGQSFIVRRDLGADEFSDLQGKRICVSSDIYADFFPPLRNYFDARGWAFHAVGTQTRAESEELFFAGECDAVTADYAELASAIIKHAENPTDFTVLPGHIEEEPLAPLIREGDDEFHAIVAWAIYALINAEALGIDQANVDAMRMSSEPDIAAFFAEPPAGSGFHPEWSTAVVKAVGNYGEIFERNLGAPDAANLPRGPNRLWTEGGILYAPPIR